MKVALLISLLAGLLFATGATALALVDEPGKTTAAMVAGEASTGPQPEPLSVEPGRRPAGDPSAKPVAQTALTTINGVAIVEPNPTCGVPFTVHVNATNQSGLVSQPGTVTLQNVYRGSGTVNYTGFENYPSMPPGGNYVVVFQVTITSYNSRGQELIAFTNGSTFNLKYDLAQGSCSKTSSSAPPSTSNSLQVRHSGKCMDVPGGSQDSVTPVQQFSCTGANNQAWAVQSVGNGYFKIVSRFSGLCLDIKGASQQPQTLVQQFPCNGGDNQSFAFRNVSGDYNLIVAKHSGLCLDVRGASTRDLAPIQQFQCHGNTNQQWRFQ